MKITKFHIQQANPNFSAMVKYEGFNEEFFARLDSIPHSLKAKGAIYDFATMLNKLAPLLGQDKDLITLRGTTKSCYRNDNKSLGLEVFLKDQPLESPSSFIKVSSRDIETVAVFSGSLDRGLNAIYELFNYFGNKLTGIEIKELAGEQKPSKSGFNPRLLTEELYPKSELDKMLKEAVGATLDKIV